MELRSKHSTRKNTALAKTQHLVLRHAQHLRGPANELGVRGVLGDAGAGRLGRRSTAFRRRAVRRVDVVVVDNGHTGAGARKGADICARHHQRVVVKGATEVAEKGSNKRSGRAGYKSDAGLGFSALEIWRFRNV